jgi:hypothetical protein
MGKEDGANTKRVVSFLLLDLVTYTVTYSLLQQSRR